MKEKVYRDDQPQFVPLTQEQVREKAALVTKEYVLAMFYEVTQDPILNWREKIKALKSLGDYLGMFQERKKVDVDIRSFIQRIPQPEFEAVVQEVLEGEVLNELGP